MNTNLFKNKNFTLTFFGALVSNIGAVLYSFAVSFYLLKITNNDSFVQGIYLAVVGIVSCIVMLFGGVIADRYNKAKIMYICDYLKALILFATTLVFIIDVNNKITIIVLFVSGILGNIVSGIFSPASASLLPSIVSKDDLQKANSYFSLLNSVQSIAGVLLAGILYSVLSIKILFLIVAACYSFSGISEMFIHYDFVKASDKLSLKTTFKEIKDGFSYMTKNNTLLSLLVCILFINFFFNPIFSNFLPYFVSSEVANSNYLFKDLIGFEMWSSILEVLFGIGMIIGSIVVGLIHYKKASNPSRIGMGLVSLLVLGLGISKYALDLKENYVNVLLIELSFGSVLIGFILPFINVPISTSIQKITDPAMLGKINAVSNIGSMGLIPLSSFLAGLIISGFGTSALLLICAIGFLITSIFYVLNKRIANL